MHLHILQTPFAYLVIGASRVLIKAQTYNAASRQQLQRLIADLRATGPVDVMDVMASTDELRHLMRRNENDPLSDTETALLRRHSGPPQQYPMKYAARERL